MRRILDVIFGTRRRIFLVWLGFWLLGFAGMIYFFGHEESIAQYILNYWLVVSIITFLQMIFVLPVARPKPKAHRGRSLELTLALAGFLIALLVGGFAAALVHALQDDVKSSGFVTFGIVAFVVSWVAGTTLLVSYVYGDRKSSREWLLTKIAQRIFAGTIVEVLFTIPLDLMLRQRESCFCGTGPFLAYVGGGAVGAVIIGPAILLPVIWRKRRSFYTNRCDNCGRLLRKHGDHTPFRTNALPFDCEGCRAAALLEQEQITPEDEVGLLARK